MKRRLIGEHIAVDPQICGGAPTFRDTSIPVADVLEQVAQNRPWQEIIDDRQGAISAEAIAEAVRLASAVFLEHARVPPKHVRDAPPTVLGEYVVADPAICHGVVTFRGTRLFVADALERVAERWDWDAIIADLHGSITQDAIAEAVRLASQALLDHVHDYVPESAPA